MLSPEEIVSVYEIVQEREGFEGFFYSISESQIRNAVRNMAEAYKPDNTDWSRQKSDNVANYNDPAHRCAYLYKYAPLHTCLVQDMFHEALTKCSVLRNNLSSKNRKFNICSLGGGPGSDIIGVLSACQKFGLFPRSAEIVDLMPGWERTVRLIIDELRCRELSLSLDARWFDWSYIAENLLQGMSSKVCESIRSADLITMVKFISAATCRDTENMIKTIFNNMKTGSFILFIDNAAGGFSHMVSRSSQECGLVNIFGPKNHFHYSKPELIVTKYGYISCYETRVTVQVLMKSSQMMNHSCLQSFNENILQSSSREPHDPLDNLDLLDNRALGYFIIFILVLFVIVISYNDQGRKKG